MAGTDWQPPYDGDDGGGGDDAPKDETAKGSPAREPAAKEKSEAESSRADQYGATTGSSAPPGGGLFGMAWRTLDKAVSNVPAVRYAWGVAGVAAAAFIASIFFGMNMGKALVAVIGTIIVMSALAAFAAFIKDPALRAAAVFMAYAYILMAVVIPGLLITSVFVAWPVNLRGWLTEGSATVESPEPGPGTNVPEPPEPDPRPPEPRDMVAVPGGTFTMGTAEIAPEELDECMAQHGGEPSPARTFCQSYLGREQAAHGRRSVEPFALDETEVTNGDFAHWLATRNTEIAEEEEFRLVVDYSGQVLLWLSFADGIELRNGRFTARAGFDQMPVAGVTWYGADGFCRARGERLPSEIEWEYAARGPSSNRWVHGNRRPECSDSVFGRLAGKAGQKTSCEGAGTPAAVGTTDRDVSWCGARDMGGNVSEWVSTPLVERGVEQPIYKGGSFADSWLYTRPATRNRQQARRGAKTIGFRCARDGR